MELIMYYIIIIRLCIIDNFQLNNNELRIPSNYNYNNYMVLNIE